MTQVNWRKNHLSDFLLLDGDSEPKLSNAELEKVKKFQDHVKNLEYKRMSSKFSTSYNNKRVTQIKESTKSPIRQVMDTISPLLTVLGMF